ncbi:MAG: peptidyl-prolyl cis-trans isomerase [Pyrinomonadaceae bacterium]
MLKFFNRLEKTRNFVLLVFAILMVASLVFFYAPTPSTVQDSLGRSEEVAATVGSRSVTVGELFRQKENYTRNTGGQSLPTKTLLSSLISARLMGVEAERLGLTATDAEVAAEIRRQFKPADGKPFDQNRYEQYALDQAGSVAAFEETIRDSVSAEKLQAFVTSGVSVSEQELLEDFQKKNTKFDLSYVTINAAELAQTLKPTDEELKEYFEKNKQDYHINVPQKKIQYLFINTEKIGQKLTIPEEDLKAEYDKLPPERRIGGALGQEIVLRVAKPEFDGQVLEKATELVTRLRKDGAVTEEAFAEVAAGHSENSATAGNGGKLPGPIKANPNKPDDPYQKLLTMKPGEVSQPINYEGRYFILRRGEDVPKSFEDAKKELDVSLRNRRAYAVAAELAQKATESLKLTKNVQQTAQEFASQANMAAADMVRETGYIKPGDNVENIGTSPQFEGGIEPLVNVQDVGEKVPVANGFAIPMLVDKKEPRDAEFEEVRAQVTERVKVDLAQTRVEEIAKQIAEDAGTASSLGSAAQAKGLKAQEQKTFIVGSPIGQGPAATTSDALETAILALKAGEVSQPIMSGDRWYVLGVTKREEANMDDFATQREDIASQMLMRKRGEVYSDYLAAVRKRMEASGEIKTYPDAIAKLDAADAEKQAATGTGVPPTGFPGQQIEMPAQPVQAPAQ